MFDTKKNDNNHFRGVIYTYVYLPVIRYFDTSKKISSL